MAGSEINSSANDQIMQGSPSQFLRNTMSDFSRTNTESQLFIGQNYSENSPNSPSKYTMHGGGLHHEVTLESMTTDL